MGCSPHKKSHPFRNLNFPNSFPREGGRICISNLTIDRDDHSKFGLLLDDIKDALSRLLVVSLIPINKSVNHASPVLAKHAQDTEGPLLWIEDFLLAFRTLYILILINKILPAIFNAEKKRKKECPTFVLLFYPN